MLWVHRAPPGTPEPGMPYSPALVPGECGLSLAITSTIALCNFGPLSTGCTSSETPLRVGGAVTPFFFSKFFLLIPLSHLAEWLSAESTLA